MFKLFTLFKYFTKYSVVDKPNKSEEATPELFAI